MSETSSKNKEKGVIPTSSITQTFISLSPSSADVTVNPAVFKKQSKQKGKGHLVRCIQRKTGNDGEIVSAIEIPNVDSVDNVIRIMIEHMKLGVRFITLTSIFIHITFISHCFLTNIH